MGYEDEDCFEVFDLRRSKNKRPSKKSSVFVRVKRDGTNEASLGRGPSADVEYSINKKQRWRLVDQLRTNVGSLTNGNVRIEALEYRVKFTGNGTEENKGLKAFHTVDDDGREIHKCTKKGYGSEKSLTGQTDKYSSNRKRQRRFTDRLEDNEQSSSSVAEIQQVPRIRYDILTRIEDRRSLTNNGSNASRKKTVKKRHSPLCCSRDHEDSQENCSIYSDSDDGGSSMMNSTEAGRFSESISLFDLCVNTQVLVKSKKATKAKPMTNHVNNNYDCIIKPWIRQISYCPPDSNANDHKDLFDEPVSKLYFEPAAPINLLCKTNDLSSEALSENFANNYKECPCCPRRFIIDISDRFIEAVSDAYPDIRLKNVQALVCFEIPQICEESVEESSLVRVSLNANLCQIDGSSIRLDSIHLDTLNPCSVHSVVDILDGAIKSLYTWHIENFTTVKEYKRNFGSTRFQLPFLHINPATYVDSSSFLNDIIRKLTESPSGGNSNIPITLPISNECQICFDDQSFGFSLSECGHHFCQSCWKHYCVGAINANRVPLKCPQVKCDLAVDYSMLTTFLPLPLCQLYAKQLANAEVAGKRQQWFWCPSPRCHLLYFPETAATNSFYCRCGTTWCGECSAPAHWPLSCHTSEKYVLKLHENADDFIPWFVNKREEKFVKIKKCPVCKTGIEKVDGCDYVTCVCNNNICWRCLKPWNHGSDHFGCKEPVSELEEVELTENRTKKSDSFLCNAFYSKALHHRRATFPPQVHAYKKQLRKIGNAKCTGSRMRFIIELKKQCHKILEYVYVWLGMECKNKHLAQAVKRAVNRLEFYVSVVLENLHSEKDFIEAEYLLNEINDVVDSLVANLYRKR